jgi:dihydroorotate dehydrogenase electron transfer subunit
MIVQQNKIKSVHMDTESLFFHKLMKKFLTFKVRKAYCRRQYSGIYFPQMKQMRTTVTANTPIARDYYRLVFSWDLKPGPVSGPGAGTPKPGQFVTIRVAETTVPLLRRPFAFSGYRPESREASIIYLKRGRGTRILAGIRPGEYLDVIGPLGNYLKIPGKTENPILVAGGIGLGPVLYYSNLLERGNISHIFVFGARTAHAVPDIDLLRKTGTNSSPATVCTDDGSTGFAGTVADYLYTLREKELENGVLYCCGPSPMLRACHEFAEKYNLECYVIMEQVMACGVGACMGCTITVKKEPGYARVCTEGPVFKSRDIIWT